MKLRPHTMKLTEKTVNLLKNFASINQSILFKKGSSLRTMSVMKNILAEADISEEVPQDFAIYDLVQFLNGISLYTDPELDFHPIIGEGRTGAGSSTSAPLMRLAVNQANT